MRIICFFHQMGPTSVGPFFVLNWIVTLTIQEMKESKTYFLLRTLAVLFAIYQVYLFCSYMVSNKFNLTETASPFLLKFVLAVYILIPNRIFGKTIKLAVIRMISLLVLTTYLIIFPVKVLMTGIFNGDFVLISFSLIQILFALCVPTAPFIKFFSKNQPH